MGVVRLDLTSTPLVGGKAFGAVGPYEELNGEVFFAVDPFHAMNAGVTDLELAPRGADGCVSFSADVRILKPVNKGRGNRGLFLEVVNRGGSIFERMTEPGAMGPNTRLSAGWLLQRGFSVVSCGWQHDVGRCGGRFGLTAPQAVQNEKPITGKVTTAKQIDAPATVMGPFDGTAPELGYPVFDERDAKLSVADEPNGPSEEIPRESWRFVDATQIALEGGFQLGKTYELTYTAIGAPLTGIGFLALRDLVSHLRFSPDWESNFDFAIAMGASQTGRLLRQMVYGGFCEDEQGRLVIDGVLSIAAGARMTEANWRFGQPSAQGPKSAVFPFTDATQTNQAGITDGLLKNALHRERVPKVIHLNTSSEYCSSAAISHISAALSHLRTDGKADVKIPRNVRMYHCASTQHAASPLPLGPSEVPTGLGVYPPNTIDYKPFVRAAIDNLYTWVTQAVEPPASLYPRIDGATLVPSEEVRQRLPGLSLPASSGVPDLLPAVDADGNELSGIRHPDVSVPLATYLGWNPRHPRTGGSNLLVRATGSTIPFAATKQRRLERNDPRPSIEERYANREAFLEQIRQAASALVEQGYLLAEDTAGIVEASARRYDEFTCLED